MTEKECTAMRIARAALRRTVDKLSMARTAHMGFSVVAVAAAETDCERALEKIETLLAPPIRKIDQWGIDTAD